MSTRLTKPLLALVVLGSNLAIAASASGGETIIREWRFKCGNTDVTASATANAAASATARAAVGTSSAGARAHAEAVVKHVQETPAFCIKRIEMVTGARHTVFSNFLEEKPGRVQLVVFGMTHECEVVNWEDTSVTVTLPMLGLSGPKNAFFRIIRPDGRAAENIPILLKAQPKVIVHAETVGQPTPADPGVQSPVYAPHGLGG